MIELPIAKAHAFLKADFFHLPSALFQVTQAIAAQPVTSMPVQAQAVLASPMYGQPLAQAAIAQAQAVSRGLDARDPRLDARRTGLAQLQPFCAFELDALLGLRRELAKRGVHLAIYTASDGATASLLLAQLAQPAAAVVTDAEGRATVDVPFPDSTTRWHAVARAADTGARIGIGENDVRTRQPLIARLQAPRFFTVGDEIVISGNLNNQTEADLIVHALLEMAHALGLEVTAEWVETGTQAQRLAALGCDVGQGRWFGDAGPAGWVPGLARRSIGR